MRLTHKSLLLSPPKKCCTDKQDWKCIILCRLFLFFLQIFIRDGKVHYEIRDFFFLQLFYIQLCWEQMSKHSQLLKLNWVKLAFCVAFSKLHMNELLAKSWLKQTEIFNLTLKKVQNCSNCSICSICSIWSNCSDCSNCSNCSICSNCSNCNISQWKKWRIARTSSAVQKKFAQIWLLFWNRIFRLIEYF